MSVSVEKSEVVVVGGGPVGLSTAAALNYYGVKTTIVEMKTTVSSIAKAQFMSGRSVEHFSANWT
jgi:2-polyprenyl-6-methoxyphenol hydroxylase-like FAD-dependent oxidoreductase